MATKVERGQITEVLKQLGEHRSETKKHGEILARLDERSEHHKNRMDGIEKRVERRSLAVSTIAATIISALFAAALHAIGFPSNG